MQLQLSNCAAGVLGCWINWAELWNTAAWSPIILCLVALVSTDIDVDNSSHCHHTFCSLILVRCHTFIVCLQVAGRLPALQQQRQQQAKSVSIAQSRSRMQPQSPPQQHSSSSSSSSHGNSQTPSSSNSSSSMAALPLHKAPSSSSRSHRAQQLLHPQMLLLLLALLLLLLLPSPAAAAAAQASLAVCQLARPCRVYPAAQNPSSAV